MLAFYSILKKGDIMNEFGLTLRKSGLFMPEDLAIANQPNIPTCSN
jgi:hypothetical protein